MPEVPAPITGARSPVAGIAWVIDGDAVPRQRCCGAKVDPISGVIAKLDVKTLAMLASAADAS
ncbi:hypothetical protein [Luteimonas suaedae]|uniref:hypothetical protein n=1 Tax=Luteimonas suaedae TaxID=2605430 RepID=UPI00165991D8|nr:hypothetical protein [Luteimonas suaedae]